MPAAPSTTTEQAEPTTTEPTEATEAEKAKVEAEKAEQAERERTAKVEAIASVLPDLVTKWREAEKNRKSAEREATEAFGAVGRKLTEAKPLFGTTEEFLVWCYSVTPWRKAYVYRSMQVGRVLSENPEILDLVTGADAVASTAKASQAERTTAIATAVESIESAEAEPVTPVLRAAVSNAIDPEGEKAEKRAEAKLTRVTEATKGDLDKLFRKYFAKPMSAGMLSEILRTGADLHSTHGNSITEAIASHTKVWKVAEREAIEKAKAEKAEAEKANTQ